MRTAVWFFVLCIVLAALLACFSPADREVNQVQETTPAATHEAQGPEETQKVKEKEPGVIVIRMPEGFDVDLDNLMVGIPVEGMPYESEP